MAKRLIFYSSDFCPFAQRVWITLLEKRAPFELREVNLTRKPRDFLAASPGGTVPAGVWDGRPVYDSLEFMRFLDDEYPEVPLMPRDSYGKFQANTLIKRYNEPLFKPFYGLLTAQEEAKRGEHREELFKVLRAMDADLAGFTGRGGPFFFGEQFTLVDALVTPFLERMDALLPHYRGVDVLAQPELCNVKRFFEAAAARESVKTTRAPRTQLSLQTQPYFETERRPYLIEVYSAYAKGTLAEDQKRLANVRPPLAPADWGAEMPK